MELGKQAWEEVERLAGEYKLVTAQCRMKAQALIGKLKQGRLEKVLREVSRGLEENNENIKPIGIKRNS